MNLYTIFDKKAQQVMPLFVALNDGLACRMVMDSLRDPQSTMAKYPQDFALQCVGEYDEADGLIEPLEVVRHVSEVVVLADALRAG